MWLPDDVTVVGDVADSASAERAVCVAEREFGGLALLGKQYGVQPEGWRETAGHFGEEGSHCSVADITDSDSLAAVRAYKQNMKAAAKATR